MWAVIDTSVYVGHWQGGLYDAALGQVRRAFIVRHSAVVLSELRRGVRTRAAERTVARLYALAPDPWTPYHKGGGRRGVSFERLAMLSNGIALSAATSRTTH